MKRSGSVLLDVFYVAEHVIGYYPSNANIIQAWDGSLYVEANVKEIAGSQKKIQWTNNDIKIDGVFINGGLTMTERWLLENQVSHHS